ncbi:putative air1 domain-containing protein [Golovinomyces cichoracearum]|uniref:Putative air1 domain-containing protein n=1 Tax=Golovinomyces cichoracearum TaxID=62708 RepID=A0A420ITI9_9PEZI|nr:putative air1 domain-containing protein [Golovinomyces cichoracearum]
MSESNGHNAPRTAIPPQTKNGERNVLKQTEENDKIEDALKMCMSNLMKLSLPMSNSVTLKRRINDPLEALNTYRDAWQAPPRKEIMIEERMRALEETVRKILQVSKRNSASFTSSQGSKPSYATVAAAAPAKTAVRIRVSGAEKMQLEQLLSLAK